jgi:hypothetical protein
VTSQEPWESNGVQINNVIREGGVYRAWGIADFNEPSGLGAWLNRFPFCYLESDDGWEWRRPALGMVEWDGESRNNLLEPEFGNVYVDPAAAPEERYKSVWHGAITPAEFDAFKRERPEAWESLAFRDIASLGVWAGRGSVMAVKAAVSADGISWKPLASPLAVEHSDTEVIGYYDEDLRKYVLYTRTWTAGMRADVEAGVMRQEPIQWSRRAIGRSESATFDCFPVSESIIEPGPSLAPDEGFYQTAKTTIPGAPHHHVMFPTVYSLADETTRVAFGASRDGRTWHVQTQPSLFETPPFGEWDGGCVFVSPDLFELPNHDFALPYTGYNVPHKYPRGKWRFSTGYLVWPRGRLTCLHAPDVGAFTTVCMLPPGRELRLNASTKRAGMIAVEVAGADGEPLPGRAFADADILGGDHGAAPVSWRGQTDLGHRDGHPIMLRFRLDRAKIYSLEFASE